MFGVTNWLTDLFRQKTVVPPNQDPVDRNFIDRFAMLTEVMRLYFRPDFYGLDNIPREGPVLLVGNHGLIGFDFALVYSAIYRNLGRVPRSLAEHILFVEPHIRDFLNRFGFVDGNFDNGLQYLLDGHIVNVMPGGAREALKDRHELYTLRWGKSLGFVRLAMMARAPVVLYMAIGVDETYRILGRMRWPAEVIGLDKYELPFLFGWGLLPRPVKLTYRFSEPIPLQGTPEDADKPEIVAYNHERIRKRGQMMLDEGVRQRRSLWFR